MYFLNVFFRLKYIERLKSSGDARVSDSDPLGLAGIPCRAQWLQHAIPPVVPILQMLLWRRMNE